MWEVILEEEAVKLHLHMKAHRKWTQPRPRHLLHLCHRGPHISTGIVLHRQKPLGAKIGDTGLVPGNQIGTIRGRAILSCQIRMTISGCNLDQGDMGEVADSTELLEAG
jgi:hypothetical protein